MQFAANRWHPEVNKTVTIAAGGQQGGLGMGTDACQPRFETRERWPRGSPCARPVVEVDGEPGDPIVVEIDFLEGRRHLPILRAKRAA